MITFPTSITTKLQKPRGTQPILLLEIDWVNGGTITYSDVEYTGALAKLISVGTINRVDGLQSSNQLAVVLDSTDDSVETIFRNNDVHLRPCRLKLGYSDIADKALLFDGLINSNISWDEGGRTLQFEVVTKLEDALVAFTMEDGSFPVISEDDRGRVWPLPFGTNCHYSAQRLTTTIKGFLLEGLGAVDPTLPNRICQIEKTTCPNIRRPVLKSGATPGSVILSEEVPDPSCLARKRNEGCILKDLLAKQQALAKNVFEVRGGEAFPQNKIIKVRVGTVSYTGTMVGTTFTVQNVFHPDVNKVAPCRNISDPALGYRNMIGSESEANTCANHGGNANVGPASGVDCITIKSYGIGGNFYSSCGFNAQGSTSQQVVTGGSSASWDYYDQMPTGQFMWMPPGTDVILQEYDDDLVYMVSLVPGTVTQVAAYRQFGDQKLLSTVPTDWYTVANVDYGGYQCVELRFNTLPSSSDQPGWEDDIIVSFVSSVGPNPVDIIEWLVETYTDFTVDSSNFAAVKALLTEFGSNFVVKKRESVLKLINEIAYQQRMVVRVVNNVVSLVYLGKEPTSLKTFDEGDLVQGSFVINYTETEKLRTNHTITWRPQEKSNVQDEEEDKTLQMRFNIPKYGSVDETADWYTQNTFEVVQHTSTFWLIRKSITWQYVKFETTIEHLDLDLYDSVTLDIDDFPTTKIVLVEKNYNSDTNTISWKAWTPIRAGETSPYHWAWPADKTTLKWPLPSESDQAQIGDGSGLSVVPPIGHPLRVGYVEDESNPVSTGTYFPSDVGFVAPVVTCEVPLGNDVVFAQTPIIDPLAKQVFNQDLQNKQNGNAGGVSISYSREKPPCTFSGYNPCPSELALIGDDSNEIPEPAEEDDPPSCVYLVRLNYIIPTLVRNGGCVGPCKSDTVGPGSACDGNFLTIETVVTNYEAAANAVTNHQQEVDRLNDNCLHEIGKVAPWVGTDIISYASNGSTYFNIKPPGAACPESDAAKPYDLVYDPDDSGQVPDGQDTPEPDVT